MQLDQRVGATLPHLPSSHPQHEGPPGQPARQQHALRILLIEDDPIDAAWITERINEESPGSEVVHAASLPDALSILAQRTTDAVFISVHPDGRPESTQHCRELVRRANGRAIVALVNAAEMSHAANLRATGVRFIYCKHPIMRTAHLRKLEVREKWDALIAGQASRAAPTASATAAGASSQHVP